MASTAAAQQTTTDTTATTNPVKGKRFFPHLADVENRKDLFRSDTAVYGYLCSCYGKDGLVCPKYDTISAATGVSRRQVGRCVKRLEEVGLIIVTRTGRASYYRFPAIGAESNEPENGKPDEPEKTESDEPEKTESDEPERTPCPLRDATMSYHTPYIEKNFPKEKQTTEPGVVVSLEIEKQKHQAFEAVPEKHRAPSVKKIINNALSDPNSDFEFIMRSIAYTNAKSNSSYPGYLSRTIKERWAEDWTPPEVQAAQKTADDLAVEAQSQKVIKKSVESNYHRDKLAEAWLKLPAEKRAESRQEYLSTCSPVILKKAKLRTDNQLAASTGFRFFLEKREAAKNDTEC